MSEGEVTKIILKMTTKSCEIDAIPTSFLKSILTSMISCITRIMNISLMQGIFASIWKTAIVHPLLKKKLGLELIPSNFRPVLNLPFLSKVREKCALTQLEDHCQKNTPILDYQSAYREYYTCETALAKLVNDLLCFMEEGCITSFIAIDLSAAFDTVNYSILLQVLEHWFGVRDRALIWLESYLSPRNITVCVNSAYSDLVELEYSVPQGSCVGQWHIFAMPAP